MTTRTQLFDAIRPYAPQKRFTPAMVAQIDQLADMLGIPRSSAARKISDKGLALIKEFEGLRLKAYPDPGTGGEPWTIGVGHTGGVKKGDVITETQADAFLREDVARFEAAVNRLAPVTTQPQFDAMVSLAFNVGEKALGSSTLLRKHNAGDHLGASAEFQKWNRADGKIMAGLTRRRAAEAELYRTGG